MNSSGAYMGYLDKHYACPASPNSETQGISISQITSHSSVTLLAASWFPATAYMFCNAYAASTA